MLSNGFIINPYFELISDYKICPFSNKDMYINRSLPFSSSIEDYFSLRFNQKKYIYTLNGREAVHIALKSYNLKQDDVVTIFTTTGNFYISGCVTHEIEKFCKWSREIEPNTKLLFVNHEFGYPYQKLNELRKYNLPIIEDCAHSFFLEDNNLNIGTTGDFVIYSFPKMFPIQIGGLLVKNIPGELIETSILEKKEKDYIRNVLSYYIKSKDDIIEKRIRNYSIISKKIRNLGIKERFENIEEIIPGVFIFKKEDHQIDLIELKKYFYAHGIQCTKFYGEESFIIPVHQSLNEEDLNYFIEVIKSFLKLSKS